MWIFLGVFIIWYAGISNRLVFMGIVRGGGQVGQCPLYNTQPHLENSLTPLVKSKLEIITRHHFMNFSLNYFTGDI